MDRVGQPLTAILGRNGKPHPAAFAILIVGSLEALRRRHRTILVAGAAFLVADAVQRMKHILRELRTFLEDRLQHVRRRIGEAGEVAVALIAENFIQNEKRVRDGRLVGRHGSPPKES
jgi:hypothetical protein